MDLAGTFLYGFKQLDPFLIQRGFINGIKTLEFRVENDGEFNGKIQPNPSGLLIAGLHGTIGETLPAPQPVPEPATDLTSAFLLLLLGFEGVRRFKHRKAAA